MRKWTALFLAVAAAAALSACGTEELVSQLNLGKDAAEETETEAEEQSLIDVKGVFYGSYAASQEGYENMYLVFDYVNDLENRTLPSSNEGVTMTVNGTNTYNAKMPEYSDNERFEKYTGYEYLIGYGDLLGGADPVRMFVHYEFNPNDLKTGETITFTLGDQTVEYPVADVQEISVMDELLKVEDDYENAQMRAAFKWRVDESVYVFNIIGDPVREISGLEAYGIEPTTMFSVFGSDYDSLGTAMGTLFSPDSKGVSVVEGHSGGFESETKTMNKVKEDLPAYDEEAILAAYPEIQEVYPAYREHYNELATMIKTPSSGDDAQFAAAEAVEDKMQQIWDEYCQLCSLLGLEYAEVDHVF